MEENYSAKIIILNRGAFKERDSRVSAYAADRGKLSLVVRGTQSLKSKLAGHIEPFNVLDALVVKGKTYDYLAGAATRQAFLQVKADLERLGFAGQGARIFNELVREGEADQTLYDLLYGFLSALNKPELNFLSLQFVYSAFLLKLYAGLGYAPVLDRCTSCGKVAIGSSFLFDYVKGGVICTPCAHNDQNIIQLSLEIKNTLQTLLRSSTGEFSAPPLFAAQLREFVTVIDMFARYHRPA